MVQYHLMLLNSHKKDHLYLHYQVLLFFQRYYNFDMVYHLLKYLFDYDIV